jgi:hypothetical protein
LPQTTLQTSAKANNAGAVLIAAEARDTRKIPVAKSSNPVSRTTEPSSANHAGTSGTAGPKNSGCFTCTSIRATGTDPAQSLALAARPEANDTRTVICASEAGYT